MKGALQAAIVRFLRRRGYVVIGTWRLSEFALERHLAQFFDRHGATAVRDVGANAGQNPDLLQDRVAFSGTIHSFKLAFQRIYKEVPDYLNVLRSIGDLDFDVSGFFPVTLDERMRAIKLDCVMVARGH